LTPTAAKRASLIVEHMVFPEAFLAFEPRTVLRIGPQNVLVGEDNQVAGLDLTTGGICSGAGD